MLTVPSRTFRAPVYQAWPGVKLNFSPFGPRQLISQGDGEEPLSARDRPFMTSSSRLKVFPLPNTARTFPLSRTGVVPSGTGRVMLRSERMNSRINPLCRMGASPSGSWAERGMKGVRRHKEPSRNRRRKRFMARLSWGCPEREPYTWTYPWVQVQASRAYNPIRKR